MKSTLLEIIESINITHHLNTHSPQERERGSMMMTVYPLQHQPDECCTNGKCDSVLVCPCTSTTADNYETSSSCNNSDCSTSSSGPTSSLYADDSSHANNDALTTDVRCFSDSHQGTTEQSQGVIAIANIFRELQDNEQRYGSESLQVALSYNAIGLFHCRIHNDCSTALKFHTKALPIINALLQQEQKRQLQSSLRCSSSEERDSTIGLVVIRTDEPPLLPLLITTYMDIGMCYELLLNCSMAAQYYEQADDWIIREEQQQSNINSNNKRTSRTTKIPKHISYACRRAIARVKRL